MFGLSDYAAAYQLETRKQKWGVYGPCTCRRPGYNRHEPENCRWCNKPFRHIYIERNKSGVTFEQVETEYWKREREEWERELKEAGDIKGDEFRWLESLGVDGEQSDP